MLCVYAENLIFPTGHRFIEHDARKLNHEAAPDMFNRGLLGKAGVSLNEDETPVVDASLRLLRNKTSRLTTRSRSMASSPQAAFLLFRVLSTAIKGSESGGCKFHVNR